MLSLFQQYAFISFFKQLELVCRSSALCSRGLRLLKKRDETDFLQRSCELRGELWKAGNVPEMSEIIEAEKIAAED